MQNFKEIVENLEHTVFVTDDRFRIIYINAFGQKELNLVNRPWKKLDLSEVVVFSHDESKKLHMSAKSGSPLQTTVFIKRIEDSGDLIEKRLNFKTLKGTDADILQYLFELSSEVKSNANIEWIKGAGHEAANIAHDLSNPLSIIQLTSETLSMVIDKASDAIKESLKPKNEKIKTASLKAIKENNKLKEFSMKLLEFDGSGPGQSGEPEEFGH